MATINNNIIGKQEIHYHISAGDNAVIVLGGSSAPTSTAQALTVAPPEREPWVRNLLIKLLKGALSLGIASLGKAVLSLLFVAG